MKKNVKLLLCVSIVGTFLVSYIGYAIVRTIPFYHYATQGKDRRHGWRRLLHIPDHELGFASQPGAMGTEATKLGPDVPVQYDTFGFRVSLDDLPHTLPFKRPLIITLGDSFTFGAYCLAEEAFPALLAKHLGGTTLNAGFSSYGLAHMEVLAKRLIPHHKPDWVVVQFSPWLAERAMKISSAAQGAIPSPYYFIEKDGTVQFHKPLFRWYNWYKHLNDASYLSNDQHTLKMNFLQFFLKIGLNYYLYADYHLIRINLGMKLGIIPSPMNDKALLSREVYHSIFKYVTDHSAQMVIVRLSRYSKDREQWDDLKKSFKDSSVLFVDAESTLIDNLESDTIEEYYKQYALWYGNPPEMVDAHPNPQAHRIIATTIATAILDQGLSQDNTSWRGLKLSIW
jgi:hypothetical protein